MIEKRDYFLKQLLFIGVIILSFGSIKYSLIILDYIKTGEYYIDEFDFILIFIGFSFFMVRSVFQLDPQSVTLTRYIKVYGFCIWKKQEVLPAKIDFVLLSGGKYKRYSYVSMVNPLQIKMVLYDVLLIFDNGKRRRICSKQKKKQAIKYGNALSDFYSVDIKLR